MAHSGPPETTGNGGAQDLDAAIAALWRDARSRALERVELLGRAVAALAEGALDGELAEAARRDAHKLAGALGTFGMPEGTERARAIEQRLEAGAQPADAPMLRADVEALGEIVEQGP